VKKHKGRDGGRISDSGAVAAELTLHFRIWNAATWASWDQVFAAIDPQRTVERRAPVDVSHPALAQRRIGRVYVKKVSIPERQQGGEWHVEATVIQWLPSMTDRRGRSVTRTPTAAAGADGVGTRATAFTGLNGGEGGEELADTGGAGLALVVHPIALLGWLVVDVPAAVSRSPLHTTHQRLRQPRRHVGQGVAADGFGVGVEQPIDVLVIASRC
jgi:hypothetical protein